MNFNTTYKAILITFLFTGIVVLGMFTIHIKKKTEVIAESFYELEPETKEEIVKDIKNTEDQNTAKTNKAYNEDEDFKRLMKNFKMVPKNDFEQTTKTVSERKHTTNTEEPSLTSSDNHSKSYALKKSDTETFNRLKDVLDNSKTVEEHSKDKSTLTYSLKNRRLVSYDTPRYLCERSGKIVVNIKVNPKGNVLDAYINGASNSKNQCLIDHALDYAKSARFNTSNHADQLGSITFYFKGK